MVAQLRPADPATIGPYRLLSRLGAGGMGQVFLARSPGGRLVAVKVIRPELADEAGFRARFAREVTAARNVSGMFTALVVDADTEGPVPWLATAYVPGPSLAELVHEQGPLPSGAVLTLAAGLAEGLGAIHAVGVVHRDLKPSNVLLAHDGPRVIDFGISRALESTMMTTTGMVLGSPGFMSPEQAKGEPVGPPSDVFSLGAVLAYAATGQGPFGTGPTPALLYRAVNEAPHLDGLPQEVRPVIERCLAKDPAARPTSAQLLAGLGGADLGTDWLPAQYTSTLQQYAASAPTSSPGVRSAPAAVAQPPAPAPVAAQRATASPSVPPGAATADSRALAAAGRAPAARRRRNRVLLAAAALVTAGIITVVVIVTLSSNATWNGIVRIADYTGAQAFECSSPAPTPGGARVVFKLVNNSSGPVYVTGIGTGTHVSVPAHAAYPLTALIGSTWRVSGQQQACVSDFSVLGPGRMVIDAA